MKVGGGPSELRIGRTWTEVLPLAQFVWRSGFGMPWTSSLQPDLGALRANRLSGFEVREGSEEVVTYF